MLHASSPRSVTLAQLRFASFAAASLWEDLHLQECAHAGRTENGDPKAAGIFSCPAIYGAQHEGPGAFPNAALKIE